VRSRVLRSSLLALVAGALVVAPASAEIQGPAPPGTQEVLYVGNNWEGTADIVDPVGFRRIARLDIVPDREERTREIMMNPDRAGFFLGIRQLIGEGNDQMVDDMFSSPDGRFLYVSRPSFADVVAFDLQTRRMVWRVPIEGYRSDHMAISPDGRHVLVSASTARKVHVIDVRAGRIVGEFESGDQPHENNYSADGQRIYHASIGTVYTPTDDPAFDGTKGDRWFQVVDARTNRVVRRIDMGQKLAEAGYPNMSAAVRPMAVANDERFVWFQVSFFFGFVEYDLVADRVTRLARLPLGEAEGLRREQFVLDSAHHGLTINPENTRLCVAGTMSNYAAIVDRQSFAHTVIPVGDKPYWSTNSGDGRYCFVSVSGNDDVAVIDYAQQRLVARIPVGDHPQRMRMGRIADSALAAAPPATGAGSAERPRLRVRALPRRVRARRPVTVRVRVTTRRGRATVPVPGARVRVGGLIATTNARGEARLRKRRGFNRSGAYRVRATRAGHVPGTTTLRSLRAARRR
jgi:YVTN family beta-propeller protein